MSSVTVRIWIAILFLSCACYCSYGAVVEDDVKCLQSLKQSLKDPLGKLVSWDFRNTSVVSMCKFVGVTCWNDRENRILNLELRDMELSGAIAKDIEYCSSLQNLDLGGNKLSGSIPPDICTWLPFLVTLDFSNNDFSGSIPTDLQTERFTLRPRRSGSVTSTWWRPRPVGLRLASSLSARFRTAVEFQEPALVGFGIWFC
ncbi:hypothetical protein PRUPE_4G279200 [Prunus persica]|uniref:Leucine-rich repeat-containing N-terminal plant-type domain-containing protein n=1 Tax=Prunus persica TaxID=3760 RepID=A0A251PTJ1_PRUPE|nr:hypothetical protein PRUPE_4G279200 [Prunus persica]